MSRRYDVEELIGDPELCNSLVGRMLVEFTPDGSQSCGVYFVDKIARAESMYGCLHIWCVNETSFYSRGGSIVVHDD